MSQDAGTLFRIEGEITPVNRVFLRMNETSKLHLWNIIFYTVAKRLMRKHRADFIEVSGKTVEEAIDDAHDRAPNEPPKLYYLALKSSLAQRLATAKRKPTYAIFHDLIIGLQAVYCSSGPKHRLRSVKDVLDSNLKNKIQIPFEFLTLYTFLYRYYQIVDRILDYAYQTTITLQDHQNAVTCFLLVCNIKETAIGGTTKENNVINTMLDVLEFHLYEALHKTYASLQILGKVEKSLLCKWLVVDSVDEAFYKYGDQQTCYVCLGDITRYTDVVGFANCDHIFCTECFEDWKETS